MGKDNQNQADADTKEAVRLGAQIYDVHVVGEEEFPIAYRFFDMAAASKFIDFSEGRQELLYVDGDGASYVGNPKTAVAIEPRPPDFDYHADGLKKRAIRGARAMARAAAAGDERAANYMAMAEGDEKTAYYMAMSDAAGRLLDLATFQLHQQRRAPSYEAGDLEDVVKAAWRAGIVSMQTLPSWTREIAPEEEPEFRVFQDRGRGRDYGMDEE